MIIHGGEPPHIETPEPGFGEVILKLDQMAYNVEQKVYSFNNGTKDALILFSQNLSKFITDVVVPIDTHLNKVGAAHNETKASVGLSKKDNYRTATLAEQGSLADVVAYVTPQGAKQAFINRNTDTPLVEDDYQQNDVLQFASYYYVNEFPVLIPTVVQGVRYFDTNAPVAMVVNNDRIVYSPSSNRTTYQTDIGFISAPSKARKASRLTEIPNLQTRLLPSGWNNTGAVGADGKVVLFKPLADKKIFAYKDSLGLPAGARDFLLFSSFIGTAYRGVTVLSRVVDNYNFELLHKFFKVNAFDTDPTLAELVTSTYPALFTVMGKAPYQGQLQAGHSMDVRNFITLGTGQTIKIGVQSGTAKIVTALYWVAEDYEIGLNVSVPVIVTGPGNLTKYLTLNFTVSIIPGTLITGGTATVTVLGTRQPDTLDGTLTPSAGAQYSSVTDPWNLNAPYNLPGVVLDSGDVLRSLSVRNGIRIKRHRTSFSDIKSWLEGVRPPINARDYKTEMYSPSRHSPFGPIPERIIPITNLNESTQYLVYGLDNVLGEYRWAEVTWDSESIVGSVVNTRFGIGSPATITPYPKLDRVPRGLSVYATKSSGGFGFNSLVFTTENGYKANATFGYAKGVVTLGAEVNLAPATLTRLQAVAKTVLAKAKVRNPAIPDRVREAQIQVYALTLSKAVIVVSDGYSYAEGGALSYTVINGVFQLNFVGSGEPILTPLTAASNTLTGANRESQSGDGVWMSVSDLLASQGDSGDYDIVITRPFGALYGDLSFKVANLGTDTPTFTPSALNPARLYAGTLTIDAVDELHPAILIPSKGVYQVTPGSAALSTVMGEVNGTTSVDPYNINEAGWVRIPAGSKVVLAGRVYMLDREYPVKVNTSGTSYCYLQRFGPDLVAIASDTLREASNTEVMFGTAVNGVLTVNESYIVMDKHVIRTGRRGSSVPVFEDDGGLGTNQFFKRRDVS